MILLRRAFKSRTAICKHKSEGCLANSFENLISKFVYAYAASNMIQVIPLILGLKAKKIFKLLTSRQKIKDSCKFSLFVAFFSFVYKACLCLFRRFVLKFSAKYEDADRLAAPLAGLLPA